MSQNISDIEKEDYCKAKGPVAQFFATGWENIVRLMATNVLFILFNIPSILVAYLFSVVFLPVLIPSFDLQYLITVTGDNGNEEVAFQLFMMMAIFFITFLVSSLLICIGPFQAGFTQVYRDIVNNTSVSLFSSFKAGMRSRWKRSLLLMLSGFILTAVFLLAISFYMNLHTVTGIVIGAVFIVLLVILIIVQNFAYSLTVSTDLKITKIYKNSILFFLIKFVPCLGIAAVILLFYCFIPFLLLMSASYLTLGIYIFFYAFFVVSWVQYFLVAYSESLILRYVATSGDSSKENKETDDYSGVCELE